MSKETKWWIITLTNGATIEIEEDNWDFYENVSVVIKTDGEDVGYIPATSILRIDKKV